MMKFKSFILERKSRNPLRKREWKEAGQLNINDPRYKDNFKFEIINYPYDELDEERQIIKQKYERLLKTSRVFADRYLNIAFDQYILDFKKPKLSNSKYVKILTYQGVEVFIDSEFLNLDEYKPGTKNYRDIQHSVLVMLTYVKDLIPNKKPRIIITDFYENQQTREFTYRNPFKPAGLQFNKFIFIDKDHINDDYVYIHELAHWIVELIPSQTQDMIYQAFEEMLNYYFRLIKKKRLDKSEITDSMRLRMAKKLGFDEYGLTNPDEFFAVLIENWKKMPNNKITYKFKSLVKSILMRI